MQPRAGIACVPETTKLRASGGHVATPIAIMATRNAAAARRRIDAGSGVRPPFRLDREAERRREPSLARARAERDRVAAGAAIRLRSCP